MGESAGFIEIKVTISEPLPAYQGGGGAGITYSAQWEDDFIEKLCVRFASLPGMSMDVIYETFAKGSDRVTKDTFRSTAIGLKCASERDVEMFIRASKAFRGLDYIEKSEFYGLFYH